MNYIKTSKLNNRTLNHLFIPKGNKATGIKCYNNNDTVIESGNGLTLFNTIIDYIRNAEEAIYLQSFLIQDTEIIDELATATERNVKVFVIDSEVKLQEQTEEEESFKITDYKNMLEQKFKNKITHRIADNLHAKFIVIDPKSSPRGVLFTGNFNMKPFLENPEIGIILNASQIKVLYKLFVYHFWEHCTHEQTASKTFAKVEPLNRFKPFDTGIVLVTSPNAELSNMKSELTKAIMSAKVSITFSTFGFDIANEVSQALLSQAKAGIKMCIYCRPREKAIKGHIDQLQANGAKVICHELIHAKSLVVDNEKGYVFTANFEKHGMDSGFEVGMELNKQQTEELKKIHTKWNNSFPYCYEYKQDISSIKSASVSCFDDRGRLQKNEITPLKETQHKANNIKDLTTALNSPIKGDYIQRENRRIHLNPIDKTAKITNKSALSKGMDIISIAIRKNKTEEALLVETKNFILTEETIVLLKKLQEKTKVYCQE